MNKITIENVKNHLITKVGESTKASVTAIEHNMTEPTIEMWANTALLYEKLLKWLTLSEKGQLFVKGYVVVEECYKPIDCEGDCEFCTSNGFSVEERYIPTEELGTPGIFLSVDEAIDEMDKKNRDRGLSE